MTKLYIILAFCFLFCANWAEATVHIVTNTNDSGAGSLRNEIVNAGDGDTIMFDQSLVSDTIVLNSGQITIDKKLSIFGYSKANLMCISGNGISRIFHANLISEVYIKYLKLINGFSSTGGAILNNAFIKASYCRFIGNISNASSNSHGGGAIYVGSGSFAYLSHCEFIGNMAMAGLPNVAAYGAAIRNQGADLQIDNCTFSSNNTNSAHVSYGGAIYNGNICEIRNTTFSGNDVDGPNIARGGAIANQGNFTELMLDFCTFFDNESNGSQAFGGAIWNNKLISLRNSLFSNNNAGTEGADFYTNASQGVSTSQGFNLFEDTLFSSITFAAGDFIGKDTLEALSYNGNAFTQTHGLRCNSFAVNAGDSTGLVDTLDQTERSRIVGSSVDIGAFELQSDLIAPIIAMNGLNLSVSRLGSYQWYKDGVLLLNDTNASLTVSANGNYYVSVLDPAGCLLNSDTVSILTVGIIENQISEISVYPNPVMDILNIQSNETMQLVNIYNAMGKNVLSSSVQSNNQAQINVAHLSFGIYFVEAEFLPNQKPIHFKFVKK